MAGALAPVGAALSTPLVGGLTAGGLGADVIGGATGLINGLLTAKPQLPNLSGLSNYAAGEYTEPSSFGGAGGPSGVGGGIAPSFSSLSAPALGGSNSPDAVQRAVQQAVAQFSGGGGSGSPADPYGTGFNS